MDPSAAQCHHPRGHTGQPGLGAVPLVGMDPAEGLGLVLRCKRLQSVLWLQGCCEDPQPPSSAGDRRILWVFHESSSTGAMEEGCRGARAGLCCLQHTWGFGGLSLWALEEAQGCRTLDEAAMLGWGA